MRTREHFSRLITLSAFLLLPLLFADVSAEEPNADAVLTELAQKLARQADAVVRGDREALRQFEILRDKLGDVSIGATAAGIGQIGEVLNHATTIKFRRKGTIAAVHIASSVREAQSDFVTSASAMLEILKQEGTADQIMALEDSVAMSKRAISKISGLGEGEAIDPSFIEDINGTRQLLDDLLNGSAEVSPLNRPDSLIAIGEVFQRFDRLASVADDLADYVGDYVAAEEANRALHAAVASLVSGSEN